MDFPRSFFHLYMVFFFFVFARFIFDGVHQIDDLDSPATDREYKQWVESLA